MMRALNATSFARTLQRGRLQALADGLAVAVAVSLPWSTSATGILIVLWLIVLLPTIELSAVRRELATPAGGLPVALCALAVLGLAWTDASWAERFEGLAGYVKLLTIPLLFAQFRRSERGWEALAGYLVSVLVLLAVSWTLTTWPQLVWRTYPLPGIPAKDYIAQSGEFVIVAFVLLLLAGEMAKTGRRLLAALSVAITIALLANVAFVAPSRTALVVIPVLLAILGVGRAGWKMGAALILAGVVLAGIAWSSSAFLRERVLVVGADIGQYRAGQVLTSSGLRMAFWQRSIGLVEQAPVLGHGTAAITAAFRRSAVGADGAEAIVTANPHNQIFAVAIQLGLVGAGLLAAMWIAHLFLFRGGGLAGWIGLVVVAQNIVSSLFNSHLFDFTQGWTYAFGVGVLGGLVMRGSRSPAALAPAPAAPAMSRLDLPPRPRILVVVLRRLGDVLLATPLMRSLRRAWPDARIEALVFAGTEGILAGNPDLDGVVVMPARPNVAQSLALAARLYRRYDLAVSTQTGDRPTYFAILAGRRRAAPVAERLGAPLLRATLTRSIPVAEVVHRVEDVLRLADALGIPRIAELVCPAGGSDAVRPDVPYAVIHAAPMFRYKRWNTAGWRALARELAARGLAVVATGGPSEADRRYLDDIWSGLPAVRRRDGVLRFPDLAALIAGARVYVGPDTSVTHLAAATGCPTVALLGPTDPRIWGPWPVDGLPMPWEMSGTIQRRGNVWIVQNPQPCLPCRLEGCERHISSISRCLDELPIGAVMPAVDAALALRTEAAGAARSPLSG